MLLKNKFIYFFNYLFFININKTIKNQHFLYYIEK